MTVSTYFPLGRGLLTSLNSSLFFLTAVVWHQRKQ